jgi:uncharacterized membrane protein YfcA
MALAGTSRYLGACCIGVGAGLTLGTVGWGGAQVIIPTLTHPMMGLTQLAASGVSISSLSFAVLTSSSQFARADSADLQTAAAIAIPSMFGARIGVKIASRMSGEVHALVFNGMSVALIPIHFLVQRWRAGLEDKDEKRATSEADKALDFPRLVQHGCFGIFGGVLSAIMGVGGLPITMTYLTVACTDLPHHFAQGTAMISVAPSVITAAASHAMSGHTPLALAACVACGSMVGSTVGAKIALSLDEDQLRTLYMTSLVLLGGRSFVAATRNIARLAKTHLKK